MTRSHAADQHIASQDAFHLLCKSAAIDALSDLAAAIERARLLVARHGSIEQTDLRDDAEKAINALQSLASARRCMTNPVRGEPLQDHGYDRGQELQIAKGGSSS